MGLTPYKFFFFRHSFFVMNLTRQNNDNYILLKFLEKSNVSNQKLKIKSKKLNF